MTGEYLNRLAGELGKLCAGHVLEEKRVIAPSRRVGFQWLDALTRSGRPVLNARVVTLAVMALELAAPEMERRGAAFLRGVKTEVLLDGIIARLRERGGYLSRLEAGPGLVHTVASTLRDLRLAGVTAARLEADLFEVNTKGREIIALLAGYEEELRSRRLMDYAGVLRAAAERLKEDPSVLPGSALVVMPGDMERELRGLERALWEAVPEERRAVLEVDHPCEVRGGDLTDAALLAWVSRPADAPSPVEDGTAEIYRAVGEVNEVRDVLRRCVERGIPFDQVEILHTDASTYIPLVYELCARLAPEPGGPVPATFAEGIPIRYSRPGRALAGWLTWIVEGYPQSTLVRMIQDGLLEVKDAQAKAWSFSRLGAVFRAIPIGGGRDRYPGAMDKSIAALERRLADENRDEGGENGDGGRKYAYLSQRLEMLRALRDLAVYLLDCAPGPGKSWKDTLEGTASLLLRKARCVNEFDEYCRMRLLDEIGELSASLREGDPTCLNIPDWLAELARSARVEGKGPRPGCLYVAPLAAGGHSGRPHTFILGLDDGRFPGAGLQDPLLLDSERERISADLPTAAGRLAGILEDFAGLAARMRGSVTLSYCCRSLADDRDMFPGPAVLAAYRILSGNREGVQDDLLRWLPEPVSFAPRDPGRCIDSAEWWLCRLCGERAVEDPEGTVTQLFPHLGRGLKARRARESDAFTAYDGYVPEAGADLDPTRPEGLVLSASRLEKLGRCPLEYFFQYVLGIEPPEEYLLDPSRWLDPLERGSLLHSVFGRFLYRLREEDRRPVLERDWDLLQEILDMEVSEWTAVKPPPNRKVLEAEVEDLRRTARIFLQEDEAFCRERRPLYFEAAVGLTAKGEGNLIDSPEPVAVELPGGKTIRVRGYIDRVDELEGARRGCFAVCDYKTGSSRDYDRADPFKQGRCVQNVLYLALAEPRLAECHPGAKVSFFEYFFPNTREHGERIQWDSGRLAGGMAIIGRLCAMLALGCFPFSDDAKDVKNSDYRAAFGDINRTVEAVRRKLANPANAPLAPFRELRGYRGDGK